MLCKYRDPGECPETLTRSSLMVDQPRKSTSGRRQRARGGGRELRELLRRGADAMRRVCGVAGECKLMRRINKWTFLIHFLDPGTGVFWDPFCNMWCILPPYGNFSEMLFDEKYFEFDAQNCFGGRPDVPSRDPKTLYRDLRHRHIWRHFGPDPPHLICNVGPHISYI